MAVAGFGAFDVEPWLSMARSCLDVAGSPAEVEFGLGLRAGAVLGRGAAVLDDELVLCWPGVLALCVLACAGDAPGGAEVCWELSCADNPSEAAANATVRNTTALIMQASKLWLIST